MDPSGGPSPAMTAPPNTPTTPSVVTRSVSCMPAAGPKLDFVGVLKLQQFDDSLNGNEEHAGISQHKMRPIYSIAKLLEIGSKCNDSSVLLKVKPEAIEGKNTFPCLFVTLTDMLQRTSSTCLEWIILPDTSVHSQSCPVAPITPATRQQCPHD